MGQLPARSRQHQRDRSLPAVLGHGATSLVHSGLHPSPLSQSRGLGSVPRGLPESGAEGAAQPDPQHPRRLRFGSRSLLHAGPEPAAARPAHGGTQRLLPGPLLRHDRRALDRDQGLRRVVVPDSDPHALALALRDVEQRGLPRCRRGALDVALLAQRGAHHLLESMRARQDGTSARLPHVVATGFTTAFLGDERTLREFVVGDHVVHALREQGTNAVLYLVNDTYDPLDERQLRVGMDKNPALIRKFRPFCGRPIAEIPDPFDCHASYAAHFTARLTERLRRLDIHPLIIDTHRAYRAGHYAPYIVRTFERYREIQDAIWARFGQLVQNLFRMQCPQCGCVDGTSIVSVAEQVRYRCERCGTEGSELPSALQGKLNWKLDCAARWNLYRIDTEVFGKAHLAREGTNNVSCLVSREFFGGQVPEVVKYGELKIQRELSGRLLQILPPEALKRMLTEHLSRDLEVTRDFVAQFAERFEVRPGASYASFVRQELPRVALEVAAARVPPEPTGKDEIEIGALVAHGNA
ncbi:MAG: hypothetical protein E6K80_14470 [Candidatus Eisenbacteria bacterium]|uniref:Uncharacterized protein n=1 Tax=Eiseniibacteriota bacterium TaxID=2212470 RepID=A0A538TX22_UNCEI|nr:MAG: hypothetical protein E6K80_14470 [Candidatus Eisenbacteria bacterium]